jgi:hypothetical protein
MTSRVSLAIKAAFLVFLSFVLTNALIAVAVLKAIDANLLRLYVPAPFGYLEGVIIFAGLSVARLNLNEMFYYGIRKLLPWLSQV